MFDSVKYLVVHNAAALLRDEWLEEGMSAVSEDCPPVSMDAEDPLFLLYTSGSTGKPKVGCVKLFFLSNERGKNSPKKTDALDILHDGG